LNAEPEWSSDTLQHIAEGLALAGMEYDDDTMTFRRPEN